MRFTIFRNAAGILALAGIAAVWQTAPAHAESIYLLRTDTSGTSFNTSQNWSNSQVPSTGNDYTIAGGRTMRTPAISPDTSYTFQGDSLTLGTASNSTGAISGKGSGTYTLTINNLTMGDGSFIYNNNGNSIMTLAGNGITLTSGTSGVSKFLMSTSSATSSTTIHLASNISGDSGLALGLYSTNTFAGVGYIGLEGVNTYTGSTKITAVNVLANSAASLPGYDVDGKVLVSSGSTTGSNASLWVKAGGASDWTADQINALLSNGTFTTSTDPTILPGFSFDTSNAVSDFAYANDITDARGAISLTKRGTGTLVLSGNNAYSGGTTIAGGVLQLGSAGAIGSSGSLTFGGGTLQYSAGNNTDYSNRFSSAAGQAINIDTNGQNVTFDTKLYGGSTNTLNKFGAGALSLNSGGQQIFFMTVSGGTLDVTADGNANGRTGIFSGETNRSFTVNDGAKLKASGEWSLGAVNKLITSGTGTIETARADAHLYINNLTMTGGSVTGLGFRVGGTSNGTITTIGTPAAEARIAAPIYLETTGSASQLVFDIGDVITGSDISVVANIADLEGAAGMTVVKRGSGALTLRSNAGRGSGTTPADLGLKTYTGTTIVEKGTLNIGSAGYAGMLTGNLVVNGGAGGYDDAKVVFSTGPSNSLTGQLTSYTGSISGDGGIIQARAGTLTYSGQHTYKGNTYIEGYYVQDAAGSLQLDVNDSGASSQLLQYLTNTVTGGSYIPGYAILGGTLNLDVSDVTDESGTWYLLGSGTNSIAANTSFGDDFAMSITGGPSFSETSGLWTCIDGSRSWTFTESTGQLALSAVPEPSTLAMLSAALLGLIAYAWRKRK